MRHLHDVPAGSTIRSDVVIAGAGPAGITLAIELARRGVAVTLLEGGNIEPEPGSQDRYVGEVSVGAGLEYPPLDVWRLRFLGGTSNHWNGWCRPFEQNTFGSRPWLGVPAWPFEWEEIEPYYRTAHEVCELGRFVYDPQTIAMDLGLSGWPETGFFPGLETVLWRFSPPTRFGSRYLADVEASGVDLILCANLVSIARRGDGVERLVVVAEADGRDRSFVASTYVLACGGLENIRHLLHMLEVDASGIDRGGWIGRGWMEHPHGVAGEMLVDPAITEDANGPFALFRFSDRRRDVDGVEVVAGFALADDFCRELELPNMSFTIEDRLAVAESATSVYEQGVAGLLETLARSSPFQPFRLFARSEQRVVDESRVSLAEGRDDMGLRRLRLAWEIDRRDDLAIDRGVQLVGQAIAASGWGVVRVGRIGRPLSGGAHHLGGTRMHEDPDLGVVDGSGRVHGLTNLYVLGSSTFPMGGFANPTLTVVALALRLAEHLSTDR